jgi:hypothetical protein
LGWLAVMAARAGSERRGLSGKKRYRESLHVSRQ